MSYFVAVVCNQDPLQSGHTEGHLACFVDTDKDAVTQKAVLAAQRWQNKVRVHDEALGKVGTPYGPYRVLVGELASEAKYINYVEVKL